MSFRIASAHTGFTTAAVAVITVPAGVIAGDHCLFVVTWTGGAAQTITLTVPGGASWGELVASHNDSNLGWALYEISGVVAGQTVSATFSASVGKSAQLLCFTQDIGSIGAVATRGGVSGSVNVAPGRAVTAGQDMLVLSLERTTATGTTVSSVVAANSETVTQLSYAENVANSDVSIYLGQFTSTANPSGAVTLTYSGPSGNGAAVQLVALSGTESTPSITPVFNSGKGQFSTTATNPASPANFKAASPMVSSAGFPSATVPAGTVPADTVYAWVGWGSNAPRTVTVTEPVGATVVQEVPSRNDTNVGWTLLGLTGLTSGATVTVEASGSATSTVLKLFVFDAALSGAGAVGNRAGVNTTVATAPSVPLVSSTPVYVWAIERSLADGSVVSNAVNSAGASVTQLAFEERTSDPDISMYLGVFTPAASSSGTTTITVNTTSTNGAVVHTPAVGAPASVTPAFGSASMGYFQVKVAPISTLVRVNLGRPGSDTVRVKTFTQGITGVRLAVATTAAMTSPSYSPSVTPDADGYAQLEVAGLTADTRYYWQVECNGTLTGNVNQVRTWPVPGSIAPRVALLAGACTSGFGTTNGGKASNPDTFAAMAAKRDAGSVEARLYVDLGDDIYPCSQGSPNGTVMPPSAIAIRNWWEAQHQQSQRAAFHAAIPTAHSYSDNDFIGSNSDSTLAPEVAAISNAVRRQVLCDGPFGSTDGKGLYWSALLGRILLIQTDSRTYMSNVLLPNSTADKSTLGSVQKAWLLAQLARTDHAGIIWFHDNQWVGNPGTSSARPGIDNWQAFSVERQEIADYITANKVPILLYVHGDNHGMGFDNGSNNVYGNFPFALVAPIYNDAQPVTFTTSGASYPTTNMTGQKYYTWLEITDDGSAIQVNVSGIDMSSGTPVVRVSGSVTRSAAPPKAVLVHEFYSNIDLPDITPQPSAGGGGEPGPMGPQGPAGPTGPAGANGRDGSVWWNGVGPPTPPPVGSHANDYYLDTTNGDVYVLTTGG